MTTNTITEFSVINQVVNRWPETVTVFAFYGLDTRSAGEHSIAEAARRHELSLDTLLDDLCIQIHTPSHGADSYTCSFSPNH